MFTVCPKCALTLVVTAADLRIAQGYVRCGRCLNVFNALARLSEERPAAPAPEGAGVEPPERDAQLPSDAAPQSAAPPPSATSSQSVGQPQSAAQQSAAPPMSDSSADDTGEIQVELDPSIIVTSARAPTAPQESPVPQATAASAEAEADTRPTTVTGAPAEAQPVQQLSKEQQRSESSPHAEANAQAPDAQQANTAEPRPDGVFELETRRPRAGLAWTLGAGALAIVLALQIVNHYRDALAAASPALRGPLNTVYSALGVKLAPRWNIHAYDVHQLGASVAGAPAGEIIVRASVKNTASSAQPLPLLRVTLQDRFGNRIAARDVPPPDYLPSSVAQNTLLAAGSRVDATMVFVDPGPQAVGFEIDACLRRQSGEVACAHGP